MYNRTRGNGGLYEYFICSGKKRRRCSQGYHRAAAVEEAVECRYALVQLSRKERQAIREAVRAHVAVIAELAAQELAAAKSELARLEAEERKLLKAHYADRISEPLFAEEQARISRERVGATKRMEEFSFRHKQVLAALEAALSLTDRIQVAYRQASPHERRLFNQAFFERLEVGDGDIVRHKLAEPFAQLHKQRTSSEPERSAATYLRRRPSAAEAANSALVGAGAGPARARNAKTSGLFFGAGGCDVGSLVRLNGVEPSRPVRGTRPSTSGLGAISVPFSALR